MKSTSLSIAAMVFFIPALAFAGQKNSTHVELVQPVKVAGTQLAPGQYKLTWEGNGPEVTVTFVAGSKTVATAPAKLVNDRNNEPGAIETDTAKDNTVTLTAVDLKNLTIQFSNVGAAAAGN
jgi:hypothetical protein